MNILVIILIIVLLFGGGGYYTHTAGWGGPYGGPSVGLVGIILILLLLFR